MTGWTKGPWKAAQAVQNNGPDYWAVTKGAWGAPTIAKVFTEPDARLIAAAPEMAELLSALIDTALGYEQWDIKADEARALLARIKGE